MHLSDHIYRWGWRAVIAGWIGLEASAMFDKPSRHTWTARTRPFVHRNRGTRVLFALFIAWVVKHYLMDPCKNCRT